MFAEWIQFAILQLTVLAFLLRNEHRITILEAAITSQTNVNTLMWAQIDQLKEKTK